MSVNFTTYDPVERLGEWLLTKAPELQLRVDEARADYGPPSSAYWFLSHVVRPHMEQLLLRRDQGRLQHFWSLLEELARSGLPSEREDLYSVLEEFDLAPHRHWFGPALSELAARL